MLLLSHFTTGFTDFCAKDYFNFYLKYYGYAFIHVKCLYHGYSLELCGEDFVESVDFGVPKQSVNI